MADRDLDSGETDKRFHQTELVKSPKVTVLIQNIYFIFSKHISSAAQ